MDIDKVVEQEVKGCYDCPFYEEENGSCLRARAGITHEFVDRLGIQPITPTWCPLRQNPLLITLKKQ